MDYEKYREEQEGEIEALHSIYVDEISQLSDTPYIFTIPIKCCSEDIDSDNISVEVCLQFTFTKTYPDEIPLIEVAKSSNIKKEDENDIIVCLEKEAKDNIGMAMTFTLVSFAQELLEEVINRLKKERAEEKSMRELELQREEEKKYHGTAVTVESFTKWRIQFDSELNDGNGKKNIDAVEIKKMTGRQLFEKDSSLQYSDTQFYSEGTVEVDESLFQELDDLDLVENGDEM